MLKLREFPLTPTAPSLSCLRAVALCVVAMLVAGCSGITPSALVRVVHASPDAPEVDIYQGSGSGSTALAYNLGFGTITSYVAVSPGPSTFAADTAGATQQLVTAKSTLSPAGQYTVLLGNIAGAMQSTILKDQTTPAPANHVALRLLDQATHIGPLDVYLVPTGSRVSTMTPLLTGVSFGANSGYLDLPAGTYTLFALPAGAAPGNSTPVYSGVSIAYPGTSARTIILLDQPLSANLQAIAATDFDPMAN